MVPPPHDGQELCARAAPWRETHEHCHLLYSRWPHPESLRYHAESSRCHRSGYERNQGTDSLRSASHRRGEPQPASCLTHFPLCSLPQRLPYEGCRTSCPPFLFFH